MTDSTNTEHSRETYTKRYVAFIDILAFSELIQRSTVDAGYFNGLLQVLQWVQWEDDSVQSGRFLVSGQHASPDPEQFGFYMFSDSICYTAGSTSNGLSKLLDRLCRLCILLSGSGVFVRGGVTCGDIYEKGKIVFGLALVTAYQLESRAAHYPRVLISDEVVQLAEDIEYLVEGRPPMKLADRFRKDFDGLYQLNWVCHFHKIHKRKGFPSEIRIDFADLKATIEWWLRESKNRIDIQAKWRWFAYYFNDVISQNEKLNILGAYSNITPIDLE